MKRSNFNNLAHAPVAGLYLFFVWTRIAGIDFGHHWDEQPNHIWSLAASVNKGRLLPEWYKFPSVNYDIGLISLAPDVAYYHFVRTLPTEGLRRFLFDVIVSKEFLIRMRIIYVLLAGLSIFWMYLLLYKWRRNLFESLLGASFLGLSWELGYHSRWYTADPLLTQFCTLTLLFLILSFKERMRIRWLCWAAVAAGLACGTKYPGGALMLPVSIAACCRGWKLNRLWGLSQNLFVVWLLFSLCYSLTTPGTWLDFERFCEGVMFQLEKYGSEHGAYTAKPGIHNLKIILTYIILVFPSKYVGISFVLSSFSLVGIVDLFKREKYQALVLLSFPVFYILYFSSQGIVIVRNFLLIGPFLALFSVLGVAKCLAFLGHVPVLKNLTRAALVSAVAVNAVWLYQESQTIKNDSRLNRINAALEFIRLNQDETFFVSRALADRFSERAISMPPNVTSDPASSFDMVVFSRYEIPNRFWEANVRNNFVTWFGSFEANLNYYPTWRGGNNIVVMSSERVAGLNIMTQLTAD